MTPIVTTMSAPSGRARRVKAPAGGGGGGGGSWQLPAANFVAAKMPLAAVYPRPDGETYSNARHKFAYPGIANRIPVVIQGGAYPYHYEIVAGPAGATIGATISDADYGIWSWTPSGNAAAQTVTVRVTDQQLNTVDVTWDITASDSAFVFLDAAAASSGTGTLASPFKTWTDAFGTDSTTPTNAGKVLVLRGGSHTMTGYAGNSGNLAIVGSNTKPIGWMAYPGETPVVDCTTALVNMITAGDGNDLFVQGIRFENARTDVANSRFFFFSGNAGWRTTWHDVDFVNLGRGTSGGTDNPGAIVMFNNATLRQYVAVVGCSIDDFDAPLFGSIYAVKYLVVDDCLLGAGKTAGGIQGVYLKERCTYGTIRRVRSFTSGDDTGIIQSNLAGGSVIGEPRYLEVCYCTVRTPSFSTTNEKFAIVPNYSNNTTDAGSQCWTYRNTIVGGVRVLSPASPGWTGTFERNVHITNDSPSIANDTNNLITLSENVTEPSSNLATVLDGSYLLTGTARTTYLGTRGAEISAGA